MKVLRLVFREVGGQQDMYSRPYMVQDISQHDVNQLVEATNRGVMLTPENLSGLGSRIVAPRARAGNAVNVPGGWGGRRWFWLMHIELTHGQQSYSYKVLSGYVNDYHGIVSSSGIIDPNLELYINNSMEINANLMMTGRGQQWIMGARNIDQILSTNSYTNPRDRFSRPLARPQDLFSRKIGQDDYNTMHEEGEHYFDLRQGFVEGNLALSQRGNNVATRYLSRGLKSWASAIDTAPFAGAGDENEIAAVAQGYVRESLLNMDKVMQDMNHYFNVMERGSFTYMDLLNLPGNEGLDSIVEIFPVARNERSFGRGEFSESWRSAAPETVVAVQVSQSVMAILMELMYAQVDVYITNDTIGGVPMVKFSRLDPFCDGISPDANYNQLVSKLETEVLREASLNGQRLVRLHVDCSIWGETVVKVSLDGGSEIMYTNPSYADSLNSNVMCDSYDDLDSLSTRIVSLVTEVQNAGHPTSQTSNFQQNFLNSQGMPLAPHRPQKQFI